jgi:hypothetical protein
MAKKADETPTGATVSGRQTPLEEELPLDREEREELLGRLRDHYEVHRADRQRRRWVQAIATLGLVGAGARELYREQLLEQLPSVEYRRGPNDGVRWEVDWEPSADEVPAGATDAGGYAALLALATIGGARRAEQQPFLSFATAGLSALHAATSFRELFDDLKTGRIDGFSGIDTILSAATVPLTMPEAVRAAQGLLGRE